MTRDAAVSALLFDAGAVDAAILRLCEAGIPRDRIDVAVSREAAERHYGGRARAARHQAMRFAAIGGFAGLLLGAAIALVMVALPGRMAPGAALFAQLVGPNLATVTGALLGAAIGAAVPRKPKPLHARALARRDAIVIVVAVTGAVAAEAVASLLAECGGDGVFVYAPDFVASTPGRAPV